MEPTEWRQWATAQERALKRLNGANGMTPMSYCSRKGPETTHWSQWATVHERALKRLTGANELTVHERALKRLTGANELTVHKIVVHYWAQEGGHSTMSSQDSQYIIVHKIGSQWVHKIGSLFTKGPRNYSMGPTEWRQWATAHERA
jgi:hypothetical protein